jgi:8-oxo-dGTP pyrophosphatase MutT (NUDIX family)
MTGMTWKPDVTVAAIAERDGKFLLVEERAGGRVVINQPAGHLEDGETFLQAIVRETLEETAWHFEPRVVVGVYVWRPEQSARTFLRVAFAGELLGHEPGRPLDRGILRTCWMTRTELASPRLRLRSPLVSQCVDDYLAGKRHPLSLITHLVAAPVTLAASG